MPKETREPNYKLSDESVEDMLATVDQFIEGIYRDMNFTPPQRHSTLYRKRSLNESSSSNDALVEGTSVSILSSGDENKSGATPSKRKNMDAEIERINRMCDTVNKNLLSIGVFMHNSDNVSSSEGRLNINITSSPTPSANSSTDLSLDSSLQPTTAPSSSEIRRLSSAESTVAEIPVQIIDLSETQSQAQLPLHDNNSNNDNDDDDVIIVSANINPVVDLCTPVNQKETSGERRPVIDHSVLSRRRLTVPDVLIVDTSNVEGGYIPARRLRNKNKRKSLDISIKDAEYNKNNNNSPSASSTATGRIPYMCAVCMESCLQRQPTSTKCGHIFCNTCIMQAVHITRKCPLCNTKMSKNQLFRIYP